MTSARQASVQDLLKPFGLENAPRLLPLDAVRENSILVHNPATGQPLARVSLDSTADLDRTLANASAAFLRWREVPAPVRGQVVRAIADEFRRLKEPLGILLSTEVGKILPEGLGEVQETIDIADFAVGLSRQLHGLTMPSERPGHSMREQWLPLGVVGVISAFNFPNAVWAWNAMLAAVCGDTIVWKPSLLAPLTAMASHSIADRVATAMGHPGIFHLTIGTDEAVGEKFIADCRVPLVSATGSCRMGRRVGQVVAARLGRCLLELGGNNAVIVHHDADLDLAASAVLFAAVGTAGQRCTTTRRLILHESIADRFMQKLVNAYASLPIGDPLAQGTLVGPLINAAAVEAFEHAVRTAQQQGATLLRGGARLSRPGHFVEPTILKAPPSNTLPVAMEETFAPILYVFTYTDLNDAIAMQNSVAQGLSSAIFTESVRSAESFLAPNGSGSDCGIANVNIGTSGAEIGGAFGGEKDTGGGRESGSDSWKAYMRRQTCTINFTGKVTLAQGIRFE